MLDAPSPPQTLIPLLVLIGASLLACKQSETTPEPASQPQPAAPALPEPEGDVIEDRSADEAPVAAPAKKDDSEGWRCSSGMFSPCDCPDGSQGIHACDDKGNWGACDCTPAKPAPRKVAKSACVDGQTRACPCGDGTFGRQTCHGGNWPSGCFLCD